MSKKVIILSGVSGSGKSTLAEMLASLEEDVAIVSADNYFEDGHVGYLFDPTKLSEAHEDCYMYFYYHTQKGTDTIIVDNTNLQNWEMAPYIALAKFHKYEIQIIRVHSGLTAQELADRNVHGVPVKSIKNMMERMEELPYPWKKYEVKQ